MYWFDVIRSLTSASRFDPENVKGIKHKTVVKNAQNLVAKVVSGFDNVVASLFGSQPAYAALVA